MNKRVFSLPINPKLSEHFVVNTFLPFLEEYKEYIYGSADVVGLMCLKVFVKGDQKKYNTLKDYAMRLGSAFQKVNFLRDYKSDLEILKRSYFPNVHLNNLNEKSKNEIINDIEIDFRKD